MALSHTILANLANNAAVSGYDLWKEFSAGSCNYWKASQQQIYRELTKLEGQGAIAATTVSQAGRPDKKLYQITNEGKKMLQVWMDKPSEPTAIREELLVKVLAAHLVPPEVIIRELKRHHEIHLNHLNHYKQIEQEEMADLTKLSLEEKCQYLTLRRGIRLETEWVEWCQEAIAIFSVNQSTTSVISNE
jgi:DNA-binding PadR family transcriptional regulator